MPFAFVIGAGAALLVGGVSAAAGASWSAVFIRSALSGLAFGVLGWALSHLFQAAADPTVEAQPAPPTANPAPALDLVAPATQAEELFQPLQPAQFESLPAKGEA